VPTERTVAEKLQVRRGDTVGVAGDVELVGPLPNGASFAAELAGSDVALVFVESRAELLDRFARELPALTGARAVWFCYRKANGADLNRNTIMQETGQFGWRPNSNVAIDEVWSAVRIRPLRPNEQRVA
jgi:hypothetical protein